MLQSRPKPKTFKWNEGQRRAIDEDLTRGCRYVLEFGGSRSGKTFMFVSLIIDRALLAPGSKHLIVRKEASAARAAIARGNMATFKMAVKLRHPEMEVKWNEQYGYYEFPNGSEVWVGGLNDAKAMERILGNEYATIYANECSEIPYNAIDLLRSRLAQTVETIKGERLSQRFWFDLNPTTQAHWSYQLFVKGVNPESGEPVDPDQYAWGQINPYNNRENLEEEYLKDLESMPERARKRFSEGVYTGDDPNAIWQRRMLRRISKPDLPDFERVVVSIDPATTSNGSSDETGIVVAAVDAAGLGYVLEDGSGKFRPEEWAREAIALYDLYDADCIVAETNQGGDMVEAAIRAHRNTVSYRGVHATRGKAIRAEPIAALYEKKKIYHVGELSTLEDQMCSFTVGFDRKAQGYSPDRVDAVVWAFSELFKIMTRKKKPVTTVQDVAINNPMAGR